LALIPGGANDSRLVVAGGGGGGGGGLADLGCALGGAGGNSNHAGLSGGDGITGGLAGAESDAAGGDTGSGLDFYGGGGGGGYHGGLEGDSQNADCGLGGGGGGGSDYPDPTNPPTGISNVNVQTAANLGDGQVKISYTTVTLTNPGNQKSIVGTPVSLQIRASDPDTAQTLAYNATGLPAGLSINASTGLISGTPRTARTTNATVAVGDGTGASAIGWLRWMVRLPAAPNTVRVANPGSQTGTVGTAVALTIQAGDSDSGQTFTYKATGLPNGLSINPTTGVIAGKPTTAGTYPATVTATDGTGVPDTASFTWTVRNTVTVRSPGSQASTGTVGTAVSLQIHVSDSDSGQTFTYRASGLPDGLSINPTTGVIAGEPTNAGVYPVTVTATDGTGVSGSVSFLTLIFTRTGVLGPIGTTELNLVHAG
jgi:hypothetical protein